MAEELSTTDNDVTVLLAGPRRWPQASRRRAASTWA